MAIIGHDGKTVDFGPREYNQDDYEKLSAVIERPYWGIKQVRSPDEIEVGRFYILHRILGTDVVIRVTNINNVKCEGIRQDGTLVSPHLTDLSVLPYKNGWWNKNFWLEQLDAETFEEAKQLISPLT